MEIKIDSLSDFVAYIEKLPSEKFFLFRGQRQDLPLLPKLSRLKFDKKVYKNRIAIEKAIFSNFRRNSLPYLEHPPETEWDWLSLMQHHGLATRLLDWTQNPFSALWFTVSRPPEPSGYGVVWVFSPATEDFLDTKIKETSPFDHSRKTRIFQPNMVTKRIVAQAGWFTAHKYIKPADHFVPLENNQYYRDKMTKLIIPSNKFEEHKISLSRFGGNEFSLFPDLDGLCKQLQWQNFGNEEFECLSWIDKTN